MALALSNRDQQSATLDGKTIVVTGASRGIGRGIAETLGTHAGQVAVNYRSSETEAEEVASTVEQSGGRAISVQGDVANLADMKALADRVHDEFDTVDVLINNAGVTVDRSFENMTLEEWQTVIDVNLTASSTHRRFSTRTLRR